MRKLSWMGRSSCPGSEHINNKYVNSLSQEILYWCCFLLSTNFLWIFMLIRVNTSLYVELKFNDPLPMVCRPLTDLAFQHYSCFAENRQTEKSVCWLPLLCCWHWYMSLFSHKSAVILMLTQVGLLLLMFFFFQYSLRGIVSISSSVQRTWSTLKYIEKKSWVCLFWIDHFLLIYCLFKILSASKSFKKLFSH